jgi:hypothetical protein
LISGLSRWHDFLLLRLLAGGRQEVGGIRLVDYPAWARSVARASCISPGFRDTDKTDYAPMVVLDYKGVRRYHSAFWTID